MSDAQLDAIVDSPSFKAEIGMTKAINTTPNGHCRESVYTTGPLLPVPFDYCGNRLPCSDHPCPCVCHEMADPDCPSRCACGRMAGDGSPSPEEVSNA